MSSTADTNFVTHQRSLSRMWDAERVSQLLEHVFGDEDGKGIVSFQIDERGYHFSDEEIPGWEKPQSLRERTPFEYGEKIIGWLDGLSEKKKRAIAKMGPLEVAELKGWTAYEEKIEGQDVLTIIPGWIS